MNRLSIDDNASTVRPSSTALLCIDSDDRYLNFGTARTAPTYPFQYSIQKNESLLNGFFKRMALTEFKLNWTLPNISVAWGNNTIVFNWSYNGGTATSSTLTIPDGFYSTSLIASMLQTLIRQINTQLAGFLVAVGPFADDYLCFQVQTGSLITFNIQPSVGSQRQLYDMLSFIPSSATTFVSTVYSGVPSMRPTDYIDIVCQQLTNNQKLKDSTTAPNSRDMLARIYLDESVASQTTPVTTTYGITTLTYTPTALILNGGTTCQFTLSTAPSALVVEGCPVVISGITGGANWNGQAIVMGTKTTSPYSITVQYTVQAPSGTPAFASSPTIVVQEVSGTTVSSANWSDKINGTSPFVIYRQYPYPKQIRWDNTAPLGNITFDCYDDQGRSIQNLWNNAYPAVSGFGYLFTSNFSYNMTLLVSEN